MGKVYGYCRVSTKKQSIERQIDNIKGKYKDAIIFQEAFTGTTLERPKWIALEKRLKSGDTVVFDEVSRMSRDAEEGWKTYEDLYNKGINLVFLKEGMLNTSVFRETKQLALTGNDIADIYIEATNKVLMILAENQIKAAFETAQHEVDFLHKRTSEGVQKAIEAGKPVGLKPGTKLTTKKSVAAKEIIRKHSKSFGGSLNDSELMIQCGISRNSLYKYKREIKADMQHQD